MPWDPDRYHKFQAERSAPFEDALRLVHVKSGLRVIDLGCGTGELTRRLADLLPDSEVIGIDTSEEMLARAEAHVRSGLRFEQRTIEGFTGEYDLVFSHAALQWVDDHAVLIPRLLSHATEGGQLVVQLPSNHDHPSHALIRTLADEPPFREALEGFRRTAPVLSIARYAELLHDHGGSDLTVFEKIYPHVLKDSSALAEWTSGTALVPYFERLPKPLHQPFMDRYRLCLKERYPSSPVFYGFRRTIFAATRTPGHPA